MSTSLNVVPSQITSSSVSYVVPWRATACVKLPTAPLWYFHTAEVYLGMRDSGGTDPSSSNPILESLPGASENSTVCVRTEGKRAGPPKRSESEARCVACSTMAARGWRSGQRRAGGEMRTETERPETHDRKRFACSTTPACVRTRKPCSTVRSARQPVWSSRRSARE
jgi:hypothetical protein